jgi:hypothetical protein
MAQNEATPDTIGEPGSDAASAHHRPEYPLPGCVPAEPDSVSRGTSSVPILGHSCQIHRTPERCLENPRLWSWARKTSGGHPQILRRRQVSYAGSGSSHGDPDGSRIGDYGIGCEAIEAIDRARGCQCLNRSKAGSPSLAASAHRSRTSATDASEGPAQLSPGTRIDQTLLQPLGTPSGSPPSFPASSRRLRATRACLF